MAARSRFYADAKDHDRPEGFSLRRSKTYNVLASRWKSFRRRRIVFALLAGWLLYLFFKHMPTDLGPVSERHDRRYSRLGGGPPGAHGTSSDTLVQHPNKYEGPIRFNGLAQTVQPHVWSTDKRPNVLFALLELKSVPQLLPIACTMAQVNKTRVHLAFMGRETAGWEYIQQLNGVAETSCDIYLHDARPDHASQSSGARLEVSARASLAHLEGALRLQAMLITDIDDEYFVAAVQDKASSLGLAVVTLPDGGIKSLSWISALDSASLSHFDQIQIDIVIQAPPESSASLMRLLRSIKEADYTGFKLPRLTIELPNNVDPFLARYLSDFRWPSDGAGSDSRVVVRHRLDARLLSPVQACMRTIESFYPQDPSTSHLLVLSSEVELSSNYFQFLMYSVLEHKFGAGREELEAHLMGISLDLPPAAPDGKTRAPYESHLAESFILWQAPTSTAALYFGDRWVELHKFLSSRLSLDPELAQRPPSLPTLSREFPAWLQPVLEMMQARGYYMMYPSFMLKEGSSAVTVHRELSQSPEEYMMGHTAESSDGRVDSSADQVLTADQEVALLMKAEQRAFPASLTWPLTEAMARRDRAPVTSIPLLSFSGERREWAVSWNLAWKAAEEFAVSVGGCASFNPEQESVSVSSLFCMAPT